MIEESSKIIMLKREAATFVYSTFVLTEFEAEQHASGMIGLVDAKGGDVEVMSLDHLCGMLTKSLNEKYAWRSDVKKQKWLSKQEEGIQGYNVYLDSRRDSPFKKW
ncbi:MAG: hypothetical protein OEY19_14010 [Gammaproteobacteria bacterium]|nr:hypothetical protein [Gammaproteobacteria bacterium]MDH5630754.1 hypothetical protein [Gammaproteobacteria bacterium]